MYTVRPSGVFLVLFNSQCKLKRMDLQLLRQDNFKILIMTVCYHFHFEISTVPLTGNQQKDLKMKKSLSKTQKSSLSLLVDTFSTLWTGSDKQYGVPSFKLCKV